MGRLLSLLRPRIIGHIDDYSRRRLRGWAVDKSALAEPLWIDVVHANRLIRSERADLEREDLSRIGLPSARGFDFTLDTWIDPHDPTLVIVARRNDQDVDRFAKSNLVWPGGSAKSPRFRAVRIRPAPAAEAIFIDVSDLISFLRLHNHLTGIQRVVSGLIETIALRNDDANVHFTTTALDDGFIQILSTKHLVDLIGEAVSGGTPQAVLRRKIEEIEDKSWRFAPRQGDVYLIAGAYWIVADFAQRINGLKRAGVTIALYVYDLIPLTHGQYVAESTRRDVVERAIDFLSLADFCLAISDYVRTDVRSLCAIELGQSMPVFATKLPHEVLHRATDKAFGSVLPRVARDYVLCVGTLEGRKNHVLLFKIWAALIRKHGAAAVPDLVLVGAWGWNIDMFRDLCEASSYLDGKINVLNGIGDATLTALYKNCRFTVFPSVVEGWGLPVGESLYNGKLCVASKSSSIPEVGGTFCDYIDPHSFFDAYDKIERLILDPTLLAAREQDIAQNFKPRTWAGFSAQVLDALRRGRRDAKASGALAPIVEPERVYQLRRDPSGGDETIPWRDKRIKFIRLGSWGELADWGCWATGKTTTLRFRLSSAEPAPITLLLELRLSPGLAGAATLRLSAGDDRVEEISLSRQSQWVSVNAAAAEDGLVEIDIACLFDPAREPDRDLYFGLSRFICLRASGGATPDIIQRILSTC